MSMTNISRDDVVHLATLSSLALTDNEVDAMSDDLTAIIDRIEVLGELDMTNIEPTYQVTDREFVAREDIVEKSSVGREELLALAPDTANHQIKVPKVL